GLRGSVTLLLEQHRASNDDGQRIVELVRHAGEQRAERRELLALVQRFALPLELFGGALFPSDVAGDRQYAFAAADRRTLDRDLVPVQRAVFVPAMPFDAQLLAGDDACEHRHRVLLGVGRLAGTERADVDVAQFLARVAERGAGPRIRI